jgi:hypothetical protein
MNHLQIALILIKILEKKKGAMLHETSNTGHLNSEDQLSIKKQHGSHSKISLPIVGGKS